MAVSTKVLAGLVDELGELKAKIAELETREKEICEALKKSGRPVIVGTKYDATVSTFERITLIAEKVRGFLTAKELHECENHTTCTRVNVKARKAR